MSDVFISYDVEDYGTAVKLAAVFTLQQWTVWWDPNMFIGEISATPTRRELKGAKVGVLLWSRRARESGLLPRTLHHAGQALIIPVLLDKFTSPPEFTLSRTFDLSDWDGSALHDGLQSLLHYVRALIATSSPPAELKDASDDLPPLDFDKALRVRKKRADAAAAEITRADSNPEGGARFGGVFISYRRDEASAYAGRLYDRLAARFGRDKVFFDHENVAWGEDFVEAITAAAESCAVMIVLISPNWLRSAAALPVADDYVRLEVATALRRGIRVIPILIQGAALPAPKELPEDLAPLVRRNALALSDTRWERDVEDLIKTLEGLLKR